MKNWRINFEENNGEYSGYLLVSANDVYQIDSNVFMADGVRVLICEPIISIEMYL